MTKRRQVREEPSRRVQAMTRKERERSRVITIIVGVVVGLAIVALVGAVLWQSVVTPISTVAVVNGDRIATRDLWKRAQYDHLQRESNLRNLLNYQQQIDPGGKQGFFTSQIQQLQGDLVDNEGLTNKVLEQMIEEDLIRQQAAKNGVTVSDAEIQAKLEVGSRCAEQLGHCAGRNGNRRGVGCCHAYPHLHAQPDANSDSDQYGEHDADGNPVADADSGGTDGRSVHSDGWMTCSVSSPRALACPRKMRSAC